MATGIRRVTTLVKGGHWDLQAPEMETAAEQAEAERIANAIDSMLLVPRAMKRAFSKVVAWLFNHIWDGCAIAAWQA